MKEKYLKIKNLSISKDLANFINKELLPGTKINNEKFWKGFEGRKRIMHAKTNLGI